MEHSLDIYLSRQKTETLKMLLQQHEEGKTMVEDYVAGLIRRILEKRKENL